MLNRRYLRIKVYQALYAFWQSDGGSAAKVEKELFLSIERTFDLFLSLLLIFDEIRRAAESRLEGRAQKHLPTDEDLRPNRRFLDGALMKILSNDALLEVETERRRVNWMGHREMFNRLYRSIQEDPAFIAYMERPTVSTRDEQKLLVHLFVDVIADHEALHDHFEAKSIHWLEDLDLACTLVKRTIEHLRPENALGSGLSDLLNTPEEERDFVGRLYRLTVEQSAEHEAEIAAKAQNWESERIALSDMILMKMALTEARSFPEIPTKVTLNEYIEVAKAYSTPKSKNFINGILDKLFAEMKANGRIVKIGRGLIES